MTVQMRKFTEAEIMKNTARKILSVFLSVLLLAGCLSVDAAFAASTPTYVVKSTDGYSGEVVCVTLSAVNIAGLQSGIVIMEYDKSALTYKGGYAITTAASGLQSKLTKIYNLLGATANYQAATAGKGYITYSFYATDAALATSDITRSGSKELILATLFFTVKATSGTATVGIAKATAEVAEKTTDVTKTSAAGTITILPKPTEGYNNDAKQNDAGQYTNAAISTDLSGRTDVAFKQANTAGISKNAFPGGSALKNITFTVPVIDSSSKKDPANPIEYPQDAFTGLSKLERVTINVQNAYLSSSRFFTDDGVIYIRDLDANGEMTDTCKVYLIPAAHSKTIAVNANVTGIFNESKAVPGGDRTKYTFTGHKEIEGPSKVTTAPTCEKAGVRTYYCAFCSKVIRTAAVKATGHSWGAWEVTTAPLCEKDGVETRVCKNDKTHTETRSVEPTGHDWGEWTVTTAPTCEGKGVETRVCKHDKSHTETRDVEPIGHDWGEWKVTAAPTCEEKGTETRVCKHDKTHTETRDVDPIGHSWGEWTVTTAPTCEKEGEETRVCANDASHTETRAVAATGHDWNEWKTVKAPDCTTPGSEKRVCKTDKTHTETREVAALGHSWQNETLIKSATCREDGLKSHDCAVCGVTEEFAYTDANAHIWEQNGTNFWGTPIWKCSVCGEQKTQRNRPDSSYVEIATEPPATEPPTTEAPTTEAPTTEAPTTEAPTTEAPTTEAPTTEAPTTEAPTTEAPTTEAPTTEAPTTEAPTTEAPTTEAPTTEPPTTEAPTSEEPTVPSVPDSTDPTVPSVPPTEPDESLRFTNPDYLIVVNDENENFVIGVEQKTKAGDFAATITGVSTYTLTDNEGNALDGDKNVMTGAVITAVGKTYTVIVARDTTSDGRANSSDARATLRVAARMDQFTPAQTLAADTDGDGKIKANDARTILRIAAGLGA